MEQGGIARPNFGIFGGSKKFRPAGQRKYFGARSGGSHCLGAFFATFAPLFQAAWPHLTLTMSNRDNLLGVFSTIYRWRKAFRNVCLLALVGSVGIALMLKNYYKATTIFYAASPELSKPELIFGYTSKVTEYFGGDRDMDRLMEIASGHEVVDYMVARFGLYQHYNIDSTSKEGLFRVREVFRSLYVIQKNKNDALELSIEDTDPQLAADMANAARDKISDIAQRFNKTSQATLLVSFEENLQRKKKELDHLGDSLQMLQKRYNIYDFGGQGELLAGQLAGAEAGIVRNRARLEVLENNPLVPRDTVEFIKANLRAAEREKQNLLTAGTDNISIRNFNEGLPSVAVVSDLHYQARKQLSFDLERYNQIKAAYNTNISAVQLLQAAERPLVKERPKRTMLVVSAVLAAFLFTLLGALLADAYQSVNWKEVLK
jgi:capsule polysaccharide export protein KpsE/RkpR